MATKKRCMAFVAVGAAASMAIGLAAPVEASASSGITVPTVNLQAIVNCLISTINVVTGQGFPDPDDCSAVPGGI